MVPSKFELFLHDKHQYSLMKMMYENEEVKQNDFYGYPYRNHDIIRKKLDFLEENDLAIHEIHECEESRRTACHWKLTDKGRKLFQAMRLAEEIFNGEERIDDTSLMSDLRRANPL